MKTSALCAIFANLENGNLTDAKRQARAAKPWELFNYAVEILGWSLDKSQAAAAYLKGEASFQHYCDTP